MDPSRPAGVPIGGDPGRGLVVAIDGPSGSGKSTVARAVATRLRLRYLDTGAMYRAVTWQALQHRLHLDDADGLAELVGRVALTVGTDPMRPTIDIDGVDVRRQIRSRIVTNAVSAVSAVPAVRARLVALQRREVAAGGIVVEGRDIGTVVAPDAPVKVFLTASSRTRAHRRSLQLDEAVAVNLAVTQTEIDRRDRLDSSRAASPLAKAPDAVELDSTALSVEEVVDRVLQLCADAGAAVPR